MEIISNLNIHSNNTLTQLKNKKIQLKQTENDSWTPSFGSIKAPKQKLNLSGIIKTLTAFAALAILTGCNKSEETAPVTPPNEEPEYPQPSQEDLDFAKNARENLESNPALLQSCLEYIAQNNLFNSAQDLLNGNYPAEWKITIVMNCIMGDAGMKEWFSGLIG